MMREVGQSLKCTLWYFWLFRHTGLDSRISAFLFQGQNCETVAVGHLLKRKVSHVATAASPAARVLHMHTLRLLPLVEEFSEIEEHPPSEADTTVLIIYYTALSYAYPICCCRNRRRQPSSPLPLADAAGVLPPRQAAEGAAGVEAAGAGATTRAGRPRAVLPHRRPPPPLRR